MTPTSHTDIIHKLICLIIGHSWMYFIGSPSGKQHKICARCHKNCVCNEKGEWINNE